MFLTSKHTGKSIFLTLLLPIVMMTLAGCQTQPVDELEIKLADALEHAGTDPSEIRRIPYLVVPIDVTVGGITTRDREVELILGMPKANSARFDLQVVTMSGDSVAARYYAFDPRLQKMEGGGFLVADSAVMHVFVPLSEKVDNVIISPVSGREPFVSEGGKFDPAPLLESACQNLTPELRRYQFPGCSAILLRVVDPVL